jgi:poly-gamma-glutamate synthesis protein (capsule biosynthesis protein)
MTSEPGVDLLPDLSEDTAGALCRRIAAARQPGDLVVVSIHWGSNWGYDVPARHVEFAHRLIDGGADIVHGHSSHHPRPIEVYCDRLILYGCGDFIDDYEGITGYERFRDDLTVMYLATLQPGTGRLTALRMVPMQVRRFRLNRATTGDAQWLCDTLNRISSPFGSKVRVAGDGSLTLRLS